MPHHDRVRLHCRQRVQRVYQRLALGHAGARRGNRHALYQQKFRVADQVLGGVPGYAPPPAGFFLWLPVADGEQAALKLWRETGVRVLPGAYLARDDGRGNPGAGYVRVALVAPTQEMQRGLTLLRDCLYGHEG